MTFTTFLLLLLALLHKHFALDTWLTQRYVELALQSTIYMTENYCICTNTTHLFVPMRQVGIVYLPPKSVNTSMLYAQRPSALRLSKWPHPFVYVTRPNLRHLYFKTLFRIFSIRIMLLASLLTPQCNVYFSFI